MEIWWEGGRDEVRRPVMQSGLWWWEQTIQTDTYMVNVWKKGSRGGKNICKTSVEEFVEKFVNNNSDLAKKSWNEYLLRSWYACLINSSIFCISLQMLLWSRSNKKPSDV